jgi:hypothetical protein
VPVVTPEVRDSIQYLYLSESDLSHWPLSDGWESLDHYTRIKTIGGSGFNPPELSIYLPYLLPNAQETAFTLGDVRLVLCGLDVQTDNSVQVTSYWQADSGRPPRDYSYVIYVTPEDEPSNLQGQIDGGLGQRPTSTWDDPTEILRGEMQPLALDSLPTGEYVVWLALYDSQTGERFSLADGSTTLELTHLSVTP